ncbi:phospholipid carrier-dependent glycosyltransferase [Streptomyces sp. TRM70308]|uniref:dolichyl-phosphate-mannose--protein mannosyltransferase n=1 Tax=Streptomyces sp. TRM70308 TaxID=3131932 RepID=UPI003D03EF4D
MSSETATGAQESAARPEAPAGWADRLRRYGHVPRPRPGAGEWLAPPFPGSAAGDRVWSALGLEPRLRGWGGPLLVALLAGLLRFWQLGRPHAVIFDETYYAKDAWSLLNLGYEGTWPEEANDTILADPGLAPLSEAPSYVVHPPVGKWAIALGEQLFGLTPFGWRFVVAVLGTLSVLLLCRIGRRLFRSTALGCLAGLLLTVDGLHFVMSRTALLDLVLMFFVLAAFGCLLVDRDRARARLAAALPDGRPDARAAATALGDRRWRLAAGVCLGLAIGTKWSGLYVLAAFGLLTVAWDWGARRTAGAARPLRTVLRRDAGPAFASLVPVAGLVYLASWAGWFGSTGGYYRDWHEGAGADTSWGFVPGPLRGLWHYHAQVYRFHVGLTDDHPYDSHPASWLVAGRPVSYFYESPEAGEGTCTAAGGCAQEVLALGTPMLWWLACAALVYAVYRWALRRDWRAGALLCGVAAGYLPWLLYQERTIFYFYAVVFVPFLCLAVAMLLGAVAGPPGVSEVRRSVGLVVAGVLVLLVVWNFVYFWPLYTGQEIPMDAWRARMWLGTWI